MNRVCFSLGSNLGERGAILKEATTAIEEQIGYIIAYSSFYESTAIGFEAETKFLNSCLIIDSLLSPNEILSITSEIETKLGRTRTKDGYQSRTLDIDIIFYNDDIIETTDLRIPHPRMHERLFVLLPLKELIAKQIHPELGLSIEQLIDQCPKQPIPCLYKS